jgi:hypothetical protein
LLIDFHFAFITPRRYFSLMPPFRRHYWLFSMPPLLIAATPIRHFMIDIISHYMLFIIITLLSAIIAIFH